MANTKITADNLAANAVTASSIADNSIGITQLNVSDGTNGQVLTTNGSGTLSFGDIPAGYTDSDVETYLDGGTSTPIFSTVGIGTSAIFGTTQISNTAWSGGAPYGTVLTVTGNNTYDANWGHLLISDSTTTTGNGGMIRFATGSTTANMNPFAGIDGFTEGSAYGGLKFLTRPSGGTATERLRITSDGDSEFKGNIAFTKQDGMSISGYESLVMQINSQNNQTGRVFQVNNYTTPLFVVEQAGNVGIGTTSVFDSNTRLELKKSGNCQFFVSSSDASGVRIVTSAFGSSYGKIGTYSNHALRFDTNDTERMRITSSGNVGINWGNSTARLGIIQSGSSTPGMNITDGATSDFQVFAGYSSGLCRIGPSAGNLAFTTSNSEKMRIADTDLLVGWTGGTFNDPGYNNTDGISLRGNTNSSTIIISKNDSIATYSYYSYRRGNGSNGNHMLFQHGTTVGSIRSTYQGSTSYNTSSDYRLKENVNYDFNALDRVVQLKPARFNFIADADTTVDGFLAHEVSDIVPEAITGVKDEMQEEEYEVTPAVLDEDGNVVTEAVMGTREVPKYQGIDQSKLVPLLTKAIQEQQTIIEDLKARIETLENA